MSLTRTWSITLSLMALRSHMSPIITPWRPMSFTMTWFCHTTTYVTKESYVINHYVMNVVTVSLGSQPKQGFAKVWASKGASQEWSSRVTFHVPVSLEMCEGMNPHTPKWYPTLKVGVPMDSPIFRRRLQGSKLIKLKNVLYIIGKLLEHTCLKWARMTHLGTWNISYCQKKGRESNWQFDSQPLKVKNHTDFFLFRWHATYRCKYLNKGYNVAFDLTSIKGLHTKLWTSKVARVVI
jgi:hypothetical protein